MIFRKSRIKNLTKAGFVESVKRFERKFFVPPSKITFAGSLLRQMCLRDRIYPEGIVNSLYFDTPELGKFQESEEGEYQRHKYRIRWYGSISDYNDTIPTYLEIKSKTGFASTKRRRKIIVSKGSFNRTGYTNGIIPRTILIHTLAEFGHFPEETLQPVILVSYRRLRFTEIATGTRVSFDRSIRSTLTAPGLGLGERDLLLQGAVIEIKGPSTEIPPSMRSLGVLGTDWTRFSKYGGCLESQLSPSGSAGHLWPAGRMMLS